MNQKGFATLEMILVVIVLGILSTIAVPTFGNITAKANTAKIQSDLSTIDNAIAMYYMDKGSFDNLNNISDLKDYIRDAEYLKPPTGSAYVNGESKKIEATSYSITKDDSSDSLNEEYRATLDGKTAGEFSLTEKTKK